MSYMDEVKTISSVGIIKLNMDGKIFYTNNFAKKMLNLTSDVTNIKLKELIPLLYSKNGLKAEVEINEKKLILREHSFDQYFLVLVFDATKPKKIEQENKMFKEILDHISNGVRIDECLAIYSIIRDSTKINNCISDNIKTPSLANMDKIMKKNNTYYTFKSIIGNNKELKKSIDFAHKIAHNNSSVLILGETGTGKELFAQSIHNASNFATGPFIAINCAAIPDTLIESVLFGTVKGTFTGAKNTEGLLNQAQNGTIFLDEINSMNLDSQAKLLRFLQDKTVRSIGDNKRRKVFCRVISAVNKDVELEIKSNKLREDLYYRLATVTLHIPPLIQRIDDISVLSKFFIGKYREQFSTNIRELDDNLLKLFMQYSWPGNVRELEHVIESAMNMVNPNEKILEQKHLSTYLQQRLLTTKTFNNKQEYKPSDCSEKKLHEVLDEIERQTIIERLTKYEGNITQTAKDLGIFRQALQYRIKKYEIDEFEYQ